MMKTRIRICRSISGLLARLRLSKRPHAPSLATSRNNRAQSGEAALEYGLILAGISVVLLAYFSMPNSLQASLNTMFTSVDTALTLPGQSGP